MVKDFQNGVDDALPPRILQELPEAVIAHLNECYPRVFSKIERTAQGSAEELVIEGAILEYREKSGEEGRPGVTKPVGELTFADGQSGRELAQISEGRGASAHWTSPHWRTVPHHTSSLALQTASGIRSGGQSKKRRWMCQQIGWRRSFRPWSL